MFMTVHITTGQYLTLYYVKYYSCIISPLCWSISSGEVEVDISALDLILSHNSKEIIHEMLSIFPESFAFSCAAQVFCDNKSLKISVTYTKDLFINHSP